MADQFILSEDSAKILQRLLDDYRRGRKNTPGVTQDQELGWSPDVYVARTPGTGIPAMRMDLDTGTGSLPIGTGSAFQGNTPGYAECNIYRSLYTSTTPNLMAMGFTRKVLNLSTTAVPGNTWVLVNRDKYGDWYVTDVLLSGLRVREHDEDPSVSGVNTLEFDQNDGFTVTDISGVGVKPLHCVLIDMIPADYLQSGNVTKGVQNWTGSKSFLTVSGASYEGWGQVLFGETYGTDPTNRAGVSTGGAYDGDYLDIGSTLRRGYVFGWGPYDTVGPWGPSVPASMVLTFVRNEPTAIDPDEFRYSQFGLHGYANGPQIGMYHGVATEPPPSGASSRTFFWISGDDALGAIIPGQTGTVGIGATVTGGIITNLGSGDPGEGTITSISAGLGITCTPDPITSTGTVAAKYQMSITADSSGLKLVGDSGSPGNSYYYGTDGSGSKGWHALSSLSIVTSLNTFTGDLSILADPASGGLSSGLTFTNSAPDTIKVKVNLGADSSLEFNGSNAIRLDGDEASPGNNKYYGTDGSGTKGFHALTSGGTVTSVATADSITGGTITTTGTLSLVGDTATPGSLKYYGTDVDGNRGWISYGTGYSNAGFAFVDGAGNTINIEVTNGLITNMTSTPPP